MKVLFITHYSELLGANRSMLQLITELKEHEVESTVLLPIGSSDSELVMKLSQIGIPYIEGEVRTFKHPVAWKSLFNYLYSLICKRKVFSRLQHCQFDIIHTNSSVIDVGNYISRKLGVKHIWHLREFGDLDYNYKTPLGKWFQKFIYRGQSSFIAISESIRNHYVRYIPVEQINVIYNGVKPHNISRDNKSDIIRFCIVGLISENKRQIDAIMAVDELVNNRGIKKIHLSIVGSGSLEYISYLKNIVNTHNLADYIEFTGYISDIYDSLSRFDVGIMASPNEAFGRVTVEYMMSQLAVIATDGGANCEIVENGISGVIYTAGKYKLLANKMYDFISDQSYMKKIADQGYNRAMSLFSSKANSDKILELYYAKNNIIGTAYES